MKRIILTIFILLIAIPDLLSEIAKAKEPNYNYYIKKGGIYRYYNGKEENYIIIGMKSSSLITLNDTKRLSRFNIDIDKNKIIRVWIKDKDIRTPNGFGIGTSMELLRRFQPVYIQGAIEAYTLPYSGIVFCSSKTKNFVDLILLCSPSISNELYVSERNNYMGPARYIVHSTGETIDMAMEEIILKLYKNLKMNPCILQDIILLSSREEAGDIFSIYGGPQYPVTSFCVNEKSGSVIYTINQQIDMHFRGILAHEYGHAWHYNFIGYEEPDPFILEGFAEWVRYHHQGKYFKPMEEKIYKKGLETFLAVEKQKGIDGIFRYLKNYNWDPFGSPDKNGTPRK